jgi:uncharacterized protein (TIGR03067 family)
MKARLLTVLVVGLFVAADNPKKDDTKVKSDLDALQGSWQCVAGENDGTPAAADTVKTYQLTVKENKYTIMVMGKEIEQGTLKLDSTKKPKTIDVDIASGQDKGKAQHGIYELDKDTFKVCFAPPEKDRPKELTTKKGSMNLAFSFTRAKK